MLRSDEPVLPAWPLFTLSPTRLMDSKSASLKTASLRTSSAGPCSANNATATRHQAAMRGADV